MVRLGLQPAFREPFNCVTQKRADRSCERSTLDHDIELATEGSPFLLIADRRGEQPEQLLRDGWRRGHLVDDRRHGS